MSTPSTIPPTRSVRGRLGQLGRTRQYEPELFAAAQLDLKAAKLRDAIQEAIETAPPLTAAQVDALSALLNSARAEAK